MQWLQNLHTGFGSHSLNVKCLTKSIQNMFCYSTNCLRDQHMDTREVGPGHFHPIIQFQRRNLRGWKPPFPAFRWLRSIPWKFWIEFARLRTFENSQTLTWMYVKFLKINLRRLSLPPFPRKYFLNYFLYYIYSINVCINVFTYKCRLFFVLQI